MLKIESILKKLNFPYIPSIANFVTLIFDNDKQANLFTTQFLKNGIILRHLRSFGLPECVRVTIGNASEMKIFINKLESILEHV